MKPEGILKNIQICSGHFFGILFLFLITAFLHFPLLLNSPLVLQFDEGIQASEIIRLMQGEAFFFYFDYARYHGILHGVFAIPFFLLFGKSAISYKLPAILFYALYIWTTYLLAKIINKNVALISLFLLLIPSPALSFLATHNWQNSIIIVLGNLVLLLFFKTKSYNKNTSWLFALFFFLGLSIYEYSYAIIYFATIVIMFVLSHPHWGDIRSKISLKKMVRAIRSSKDKVEVGLKIFDAIILIMFMATIFAYVWGGFAIDIFHFSIFQIHKFNKAALQVLVLIIIRLAISRRFLFDYQQWFFRLIQKTGAKQRKVIGYGLTGFLIGISPRIISIFQGNTTKGGKGFDLNIDPFALLKHLWVLISVRIPDVLGVREPILKFFKEGGVYDDSFFLILNSLVAFSLLALVLMSLYKFSEWKWDSIKNILLLKKIDHDPTLAFILVPLFVVLANMMPENGPITVRYVYPFFGMALICVAFFIEKTNKKSLIIFSILLWAGFQGFNNYQFYKNSGMINGFTPIKKPFYLQSAIEFMKTKNIRFVYTNYYTALQAQLTADSNMIITSNLPRTWGRLSREKPANPKNFAIIFNSINYYADENIYLVEDFYKFSQPTKKLIAERIKGIKNNPYQKFFDEHHIAYKIQKQGPHYIFWDIEADQEEFSKLISIIG
mgnify:FL=1